MSRSPQTLAPVQARITPWNGFIGIFAWLWHVIWWVWSTVMVGGLLVSVVLSYATTGTSGLADPRTWVVIRALLAHPLRTTIAFVAAIIITLLALLAHRHQKRVEREEQKAYDESLVNIGRGVVVASEGVRTALEELKARPVVSSPFPSNVVHENQEATSATIWNVPFRRNALFTGREEVLQRLHDKLAAGKTTALTQAISGLGGIGKTQTVLEYAYRYREEYRYVFWVKADKREELATDFAAMAHVLNLPERNAQDQKLVVEAVKRWLEGHTDWLLILDNADDLGMAADFLPVGSKGHILLTTRAWAMGNLAQSVEIEKMEAEEGALFLLHRARVLAQDAPLDNASADDQAKAREIVQAVDGLPLALDQAGAYIEETRCGLLGYLKIYQEQKQRTELHKRRGGIVTDHLQPVATTWSLSFQKVEQANPAAADLLRLCAFLSPDAIPEEIITEGAADLGQNLEPLAVDPIKLNAAIGELLKYSLVRRNADQTLTIHRLVQVVLKDGMNEKTQRLWAERAVRAVNRVFPEVEYETWPQCRRYMPHAQVCADLIVRWGLESPEAGRLLNQAEWYLRESGQYVEAEPYSQQALAIRERVRDPDQDDIANSLANLALLYERQGKYAEALPLFQRALAIYEKELGSTHPDTATSLNNLAGLYQSQGKYAEALPLYQRALAISEKALGREHPTVAIRLNNLAGLYADQGKYVDAEPLYQRAIAIDEKALGPGHPDLATDLENYADLLRETGRGDEAAKLEGRAKEIRDRHARENSERGGAWVV